MATSPIRYETRNVDGVNIFFRTAGSSTKPGLLLLHGHASSSHIFRNIIAELAEFFYVVAPDYPGFGNSDRPDPSTYKYTFENIGKNTMTKFTELVGLEKFVVYTFDYAAPVGFWIAETHPERITGIFTQSGNAYDEGLSPAFQTLRQMWAEPENDEIWQKVSEMIFGDLMAVYKAGVADPDLISPDAGSLDVYFISRPGAMAIQKLLLYDYANVVKKYPDWQAYLREKKPKVVGRWGKNDMFFIPPGAEAFKRDVPDADIQLLDAGHFVVESNPQDIIAGLKKFL